MTSAADLGVDVDGLYPALADWLRWRWRRHQKDRPNDGLWIRAARTELPRQRAAADTALVSNIDLLPTILSVTGIAPDPTLSAIDGLSLVAEPAHKERLGVHVIVSIRCLLASTAEPPSV